MERKLEVGCHLIFTDPMQKRHYAVVVAVWPNEASGMGGLNPLEQGLCRDGVNLVYVSDDPAKDDIYGRQIERACSVVHRSLQAAPGGANSWRWPDE